jgi:hypothetical protein
MRNAWAAAILLATVTAPAPGRAEEISQERLTWLSLKKSCEGGGENLPKVCALVKDGLPSAEAWQSQGRVTDRALDQEDKVLATRALDPGGQIAPIAPVSQSALAWGVTQFLTSRAEAELRLWLVDRVFDTICVQEVGTSGPLLPETCALRDQLHLTGIAASPGLLHNAVERDLTSLPAVVLGAAVKDRPARLAEARTAVTKASADLDKARAALKAGSPGSAKDGLTKALKEVEAKVRAAHARLASQLTAAESVAVAYQVAVVVRTMLQTDDPRSAFAALANLGIQQAAGDDARLAGWIEAGATVFSTLQAADASGGAQWPGEKDWGYVLLSLSMNWEAGRLVAPIWPKPTVPVSQAALVWQHELVTGLQKFFANADQIRADLKRLRRDRAQPQEDGRRRGGNIRLLAAVVAESLQGTEALAAIAGGRGLTDNQQAALVLAREVMEALSTGDYLSASGRLVTAVSQGMKPGRAQRVFIRGTSLALEVASAQDSAGVEAVLNRYAAPAGSYVGKHKGDAYYVGVNAYFGVALALERAKQDQGSWNDARWGKVVGVWAPIGIEFGKSTPWGSFGVFGQVIDVGVLASWRLKTTDADQLASPPAVGFRQIVSPGGYFVWGWPGQPISVAVGAAISPSLREVGGDSSKQRDAWRIGVNIALDIPVFP